MKTNKKTVALPAGNPPTSGQSRANPPTSGQPSVNPPGQTKPIITDWRSDLPPDYRRYLEHQRRTPPAPQYAPFELAAIAAILSLKQEPGVPLHMYLGDAYDLLTVAGLFNARQLIAVSMNAISRPSEPTIQFDQVLKDNLLGIGTRKGLIGAIKRAYGPESAAAIINSGRLSDYQIAAIKFDQQQRKQARAATARQGKDSAKKVESSEK